MQAKPQNLAMYEARQRLGLTQAQVAERVGVAPATVANIEQGRRQPSLHLATKLARLFGLTERDFLMDAVQDGHVPAAGE